MLNLDIHQDRRRLGDRTVPVIDEAGMVGTRTLAPLLQHASAAGAKVVLVGDPKQLPEIQAGGVLPSLADRHPILTLTENRRQHDPAERVRSRSSAPATSTRPLGCSATTDAS